MPNIQEFPSYLMVFVKDSLSKATGVYTESAKFGSKYMQDAIKDSPTGRVWHELKNMLNGYPSGARIGSAKETNIGYRIFMETENPGQMLRSVEFAPTKQQGLKAVSQFGWINNQKDYFLAQDTGSYIDSTSGGKPSGVGMGLLNVKSGGGRKTLRNLGAYNATKNHLIDEMKKQGFTISGQDGDLF